MPERDAQSPTGRLIAPEHANFILSQCADVTLILDDDLYVVKALCAFDFDSSAIKNWRKLPFAQLVANDSQPKLEYLFADNCAAPGAKGRWRHLNMKTNTKPDLPLLLKYFCFHDDGGLTQVICARDLRPLLGIQERFQREVELIDREKSELEEKLKHRQ